MSSVHIFSKSTADSEFHIVPTVIISILGLLFNRPITVLWKWYFSRRGWLPSDVESQAPDSRNCQDRSSDGSGGGSNQGQVDPSASAGGEAGPGDSGHANESQECRVCFDPEGQLLELLSGEQMAWS